MHARCWMENHICALLKYYYIGLQTGIDLLVLRNWLYDICMYRLVTLLLKTLRGHHIS